MKLRILGLGLAAIGAIAAMLVIGFFCYRTFAHEVPGRCRVHDRPHLPKHRSRRRNHERAELGEAIQRSTAM